ncbi:hypothetical protein P6F34_gp11 [Pseudomonas phage MiCath]|uniref:Uncharacterized protein n=1 Tax=Pseudomonas phage MiCath TaxID=3003729 RepID=A0AAE9VJU5_9CAUD|nr:hypothetical protein P6F34_gp11 [Pseudomonas phage MiCath]WAX22365.1 hypothetical protein [Pseudomonas phage MiCath]
MSLDIRALTSDLKIANEALAQFSGHGSSTIGREAIARALQELERFENLQMQIREFAIAPVAHAKSHIEAIRQVYSAIEDLMDGLAHMPNPRQQLSGHYFNKVLRGAKLAHLICTNAITNIGAEAPPIPKAGEAFPPPSSTWNENKEWHKTPTYVAYMMENGSWLKVEGDQPFSVPSLQDATVFGSEEKVNISDNIGPLLPIRVAYVSTVRVCELQQS